MKHLLILLTVVGFVFGQQGSLPINDPQENSLNEEMKEKAKAKHKEMVKKFKAMSKEERIANFKKMREAARAKMKDKLDKLSPEKKAKIEARMIKHKAKFEKKKARIQQLKAKKKVNNSDGKTIVGDKKKTIKDRKAKIEAFKAKLRVKTFKKFKINKKGKIKFPKKEEHKEEGNEGENVGD